MCLSVRGARKAKYQRIIEYFLPIALPPGPIKADLIMVVLIVKAFQLYSVIILIIWSKFLIICHCFFPCKIFFMEQYSAPGQSSHSQFQSTFVTSLCVLCRWFWVFLSHERFHVQHTFQIKTFLKTPAKPFLYCLKAEIALTAISWFRKCCFEVNLHIQCVSKWYLWSLASKCQTNTDETVSAIPTNETKIF